MTVEEVYREVLWKYHKRRDLSPLDQLDSVSFGLDEMEFEILAGIALIREGSYHTRQEVIVTIQDGNIQGHSFRDITVRREDHCHQPGGQHRNGHEDEYPPRLFGIPEQILSK